MLRRRTGRVPSPPSVSRAAAILLLAVSVATSGVELDTLFFDSSAECDYDGSYSINSSDASGSGSSSNLTANFTELCSGMIDVNSSEPIYSYPRNSSDRNYTYTLCNDQLYSGNLSLCNQDLVTLRTESLTYRNARSTIVAHINTTETQSKLYYKLCYRLTDDWEDQSELIQCISNGTTMRSNYKWKVTGEVLLTVQVYTSSNFSDSAYLACGFTKVTVASNKDLDLRVELVNEPAFVEEGTQLYGDKAMQCDAVSSQNREEQEEGEEEGEGEEGATEKPPLVAGNITFLTFANITFDNVEEANFYYKYIIEGPYIDRMGACVRQSNWTGEYLESGSYRYHVHAIAVLNPDLAFHAKVTGRFEILEAVSDAVVQVGNNNSVKVGSTEEVTIAAEGSTPIQVCWTQNKLDAKSKDMAAPRAPPDHDSKDPRPVPPLPPPPPRPPKDHAHPARSGSGQAVRECYKLVNSSLSINKYYNEVGMFQYSAVFCNKASQIQRNFSFRVISGTSPVVVASSATAVVVVAVLVTISVVVVVLMVGGYIPYRRYKNRMTETADFRFVDLSEKGSNWDRVKLKTNQLMDYFRNRRKNEKIGLVNMGSDPSNEDQRRLFYGSNTLTQFAPYETI